MSLRLDIFVKEKLNISRQKSAELIKGSSVRVNGKIILKPSFQIEDTDKVDVSDTDDVLKYVSRGGYKLEKAIELFNIDLKDKICIDIGASTGGFTDCMLKNGAKKVYACDVGSNQLVDILKNDKRVISIENTDIRNLCLNEKADFISCDVSFISLKYIIPKARDLVKDNGKCVFLIKPQFEAGREFINKNGIVKNPKVHKRIIKDLVKCFNENNFYVNSISFSPIKGGDGNIEYIICVGNEKRDVINTDYTVDEAFKNL
ncbi:MAG: TlyA family RNA methyltransferase [Lachnospirales bacterium]